MKKIFTILCIIIILFFFCACVFQFSTIDKESEEVNIEPESLTMDDSYGLGILIDSISLHDTSSISELFAESTRNRLGEDVLNQMISELCSSIQGKISMYNVVPFSDIKSDGIPYNIYHIIIYTDKDVYVMNIRCAEDMESVEKEDMGIHAIYSSPAGSRYTPEGELSNDLSESYDIEEGVASVSSNSSKEQKYPGQPFTEYSVSVILAATEGDSCVNSNKEYALELLKSMSEYNLQGDIKKITNIYKDTEEYQNQFEQGYNYCAEDFENMLYFIQFYPDTPQHIIKIEKMAKE